ncbi:MAG: hypothetical protein IT431_13910, partial [Phycisphaerales bacterium]|nr:hypothetical protein [Phycisphaerales bacterium]
MAAIDIQVDDRPRTIDPDLSRTAEQMSQPEPGPVTAGPNRYTIRVPSEGTKLSLGEGDLVDTASRNQRPGVGTDAGIVAQTDNHIHLSTFGVLGPEVKTIVRLGTPAVSVPALGPGGAGGGAGEAGVACVFPEAYDTWNGYSMVTQGGAYQEARFNHLIVSAEGEVRVVGKTLVSLGTPGDVIIGAAPDAPVTELVLNDGD